MDASVNRKPHSLLMLLFQPQMPFSAQTILSWATTKDTQESEFSYKSLGTFPTDDTFIGAAHRARMARIPKACAIKATAHQLARLIYAMLTQGKAYIEYGIDRFESEHRNKQLRQLQRKAAQLGFVLTEKPALKMQHDHILG